MVKRCIFCGKKIDEKGRCQNHDCPDYIRTQILEAADKSTPSTGDGTSTTAK